jgi:integrase
MSVRKRTWKNAKGEPQEAWVVDYVDQHSKRHLKTFVRKKEADAWHATANVEVRQGVHTADADSITVAQAGDYWIATAEGNNLERTTIHDYRMMLRLHIVPRLGSVKLSKLSAPMVRDFEDQLRRNGMTPMTLPKVRTALSMLLSDAQERGFVNRNVVRELRRTRERKADRRQKGKLKVGVAIPTPDEIRAIIGHLHGRWRPLLLTAIFCGLRASELRGLRWQDIDFNAKELHVRQRADRFHAIGRPKSEAGERRVAIPAPVLNALREWKLKAPKSKLDLAFCNPKGNVESRGNIIGRGLIPIEIAARVTVQGEDGNPKAKYTGLHAFRHFFASWCINRKVDGGLELPPKVVQERLGHSSIGMTMDVYGHLFPRGDDDAELAVAASHLFVV